MELAREQTIGTEQRTREGWLGIVLATLRKVRIARKPRSLRIGETLQLGEKRQLLVVEWESKRYLIGATQQGFSVLDCGAAATTKEIEAG